MNARLETGARRLSLALGVASLAALAAVTVGIASKPAGIPKDLSATGLYSDGSMREVARGVVAFEPQYPLWSDGATKKRWMRLPPRSSIDARDPDHLAFPVGTRFWKEFSFERRVETRTLTLEEDGTWTFATYAWNADGSSAPLAPEGGVRGACESAPGVSFDIPGRTDCRACHEAGPNAVLGFTPLQLSADRDPLAPHATPPAPDALDLGELVRRGLVRNLPERFVAAPPRIEASSPRERAALGYLASNCGICHTSEGALAGLGLDLSYPLARETAAPAPALATAVERPSLFRWAGDTEPLRIDVAAPARSVLARRMASRDPLSQMPPLGTHRADADALRLLDEWIRTDLAPARDVPESNATEPSDRSLPTLCRSNLAPKQGL